MERTQQVVEDGKASYYYVQPCHHPSSVILARPKRKNGYSGLSRFITGWPPSPPPSSPSNFQGPPVPFTHLHPTLGLKLENQPSSAQRAQETQRIRSRPLPPPHQREVKTRVENNQHPRPGLGPSQKHSHASHRDCFTLLEARRNESFLGDLQTHRRHFQNLRSIWRHKSQHMTATLCMALLDHWNEEMFKIMGAPARDKPPLEFIKTRPWGSHSRGEGRSRESGRKWRSCWGTLGWTESRATTKHVDSIMSALVSELSAPVRIKQKLKFAEGMLWVTQCAGRLTTLILINPHYNEAGIIMAIL